MNQRSHLGTSYLDIAKGAVETFLKVNEYTTLLHILTLLKTYEKPTFPYTFSQQLRSRDPASRGDRYMLVSFEEAPAGIKVQTLISFQTGFILLQTLSALASSVCVSKHHV